MRGNGRSRLALVAAHTLTVSLLPGCGGDSMGPAPNVDLAATRTAFEQVLDRYFDDNHGLDSLESSLAVFGTDITTALQISLPTEEPGTTYEYKDTQYSPSDPPREGAPENGVRFILYDDTTTLNEVGYVDFSGRSILDAEAPTVDVSFRGFITAISPTMPVLDYQATGTSSATGGALSFSGFLSDSSSQLDFDFEISGSNSTVRSATFALGAGDVTLAFQVTSETPPSQTLETSIAAGSGEIRFLVEVDANSDIQDGSGVFLNDGSGEVLVAKFAGTIGQATQLTNAEGNALTQQELVALANIFVAIEYSFALAKELFTFGLTLVGVLSFF